MCAIRNNKIILKGYRNHKRWIMGYFHFKEPASYPNAVKPQIRIPHCIELENQATQMKSGYTKRQLHKKSVLQMMSYEKVGFKSKWNGTVVSLRNKKQT